MTPQQNTVVTLLLAMKGLGTELSHAGQALANALRAEVPEYAGRAMDTARELQTLLVEIQTLEKVARLEAARKELEADTPPGNGATEGVADRVDE